jgi:hypothetical protein
MRDQIMFESALNYMCNSTVHEFHSPRSQTGLFIEYIIIASNFDEDALFWRCLYTDALEIPELKETINAKR